ncbi:MAG: AMP-binding protein [Renibacterium sp.]|nr:AMP-binding protein [Renibacterium sp.]
MATLDAALRATAGRVPERKALLFEDQEYSYRQLDEEVSKVAGALAQSGVGKGDRVALMAHNSDRFVVVVFAVFRLGAIFVPVNPGAAAPELDYLLRDCGAKVLVFDPELVSTVHAAGKHGLPEGVQLFASGDCAGFPDLFALATGFDGELSEAGAQESDDALILYTSGTTGSPKGALFDHHRTLWAAFSFVGTCGMMDGDRFLHVAPLYHAAQTCIMVIPGVLIGATNIVHRGFQPAKVLNALEEHRITMFFGVPTMFQFLLREPDFASRDLSELRTAMFGAAPMPASAVEQLIETLPAVNLLQLCGQTEAGPGGIFSSREQVSARPDASGRQPTMMAQCRVVDADGKDVAPGEVGEMLIRSEMVMKGYWNKPEQTAAAIRDGWLHTGDLLRLDPDGYMTLVDRLKDMIITGGRNVYSVEVENAVAAHPSVLDCAVIAQPHPEYGESIVAIVVLKPDTELSLEELREFCSERIARYKLPHRLVVKGQLPRNPPGKLLKRAIRDELAPA